MNIHTSVNVPDSTYFSQVDVEPTIEDDGSITIYDGNGTRRSSWGAPGVTSTVVLDECDFVAIHVGFHHKYRGGQAWYYYTTDGTQTRRITWQQMPDELRQRVLDNINKAPSWAKTPGKLSTQRAKPSKVELTSYKLVKFVGVTGRMVSLYDGETEYVIGKRLTEAAQANHGGGYYSHPTSEQVMQMWQSGDLVPANCKRSATRLALLECKIGGRIVHYSNGKMSSTHLTPVRIVSEFDNE